MSTASPDPQRESEAVARHMQAYAEVSTALSGALEAKAIAQTVLRAIGDDVAGIAVYVALGEGAPAGLLSHAGFAGRPVPDADTAPRAPSSGSGVRLLDGNARPAWVGAHVTAFVSVPLGADAATGISSSVLFALRRCDHVPSLLALLRLAAQRIADHLSAAQPDGAGAALAQPGGPARTRVLLIDDEPLLVAHVQRILLRAGFDVQAVQHARDGLALAATFRPDVILVDKVMPDMDGLDLLKAVRRHVALSLVPVIMMSGRADEAVRVSALGAGADDFIVKPFSSKDLVARINANVRLVRIRRSAVWRQGELVRLLQSQRELRKLLDTVQNVRAEERRRLAREVHDQLGQILTAVKIDIRLLQDRLLDGGSALSSEEILADLGVALQSVDQAIASVQNISILLRPPALEEGGLIAALNWQAADFQRRTRIACSFTHDPTGYVEPASFVAGELFRMCQEALTNVVRHAGASCVRIGLAVRGKWLVVRVCDNGVGIGREMVDAVDSIGLKGMSERATSIRATLQVRGRRGGGTMVAIRRRQGRH